MSANNELQIQKSGGKYRIANVDVDGAGGFYIDDKEYDTLESAVIAANAYMADPQNEVEYGLNIKT